MTDCTETGRVVATSHKIDGRIIGVLYGCDAYYRLLLELVECYPDGGISKMAVKPFKSMTEIRKYLEENYPNEKHV